MYEWFEYESTHDYSNTFGIPWNLQRIWIFAALRDFDTEFWLSAIRPVAHSLSGRLIKDVLQFNGSLYSEEKYEL